MWRAFAALLLFGCASVPGGTPAPAPPAAASIPTKAQTSQPTSAPAADKPAGWDGVDAQARAAIRALATDYVAFLSSGKTPRRAVAELVRAYSDGAAELGTNIDSTKPSTRPAATPGARYWFAGHGGAAAAFVRLGKQPVEQGVRLIVVSVDAPRIELKQRPVYERAGLVVLDTMLHGELHLPSWLSHPLALYLHAAQSRGIPAQPSAADRVPSQARTHGGIHIVLGEAEDDPVLAIPDLLPHLSRNVQGKAIVDSPERMDAIAARSAAGLASFLASKGVSQEIFAESEAALVPAGPAVLVGVDRGLVAGYGQSGRALAFAAVRALRDVPVPDHTAVVVAVSDLSDSASGVAFARMALSRVLTAFAHPELDGLGLQQFHARSAGLAAMAVGGELNRGVVLAPFRDDAVPEAMRRVLDRFTVAGVPYRIDSQEGWGTAQTLSDLNMYLVEIGIPVSGTGTPYELISTLDLYQAVRACTAWMTQP